MKQEIPHKLLITLKRKTHENIGFIYYNNPIPEQKLTKGDRQPDRQTTQVRRRTDRIPEVNKAFGMVRNPARQTNNPGPETDGQDSGIKQSLRDGPESCQTDKQSRSRDGRTGFRK
jgi:hypothetical protein